MKHKENWDRVMIFQSTNRKKANIFEQGAILSQAFLCKVPELGLTQIYKDLKLYPIFDAMAMAISYWSELDLTRVASITEEILNETWDGSKIESYQEKILEKDNFESENERSLRPEIEIGYGE